MPATSLLKVNVDHAPNGGWKVELADQGERVECETLEDAKRIAYLRAAFRHPCELVVRDAYHRVILREVIDADGDGAPAVRHDREPLLRPTRSAGLPGGRRPRR